MHDPEWNRYGMRSPAVLEEYYLRQWATTTSPYLNLAHYYIGVKEAKALVENTKLERLILNNSGIGDDAIKIIAQGPSLTCIHLACNSIGDIGIEALAANTKLTELNISINHIGVNGIKAIAKNDTLKYIDMSWCDIKEAGALLIAENTTLTTVILTGNKLGAKGTIAIEEMIKRNRILVKLRKALRGCRIIPLQRLIKKRLYANEDFVLRQRKSPWWPT